MIDVESFYRILTQNQVEHFSGVPDSLLKSFCAYISDNVEKSNHVIAANEGAAVGIATGYHLATGNIPMVYMQNSGLGNAVNPLLSIADDDVYGIPMVLLIGWRGQPSVKDEPQHVKQGRITEQLLNSMEIAYVVITQKGGEESVKADVEQIIRTAKQSSRPVAILVEKGSFNVYQLADLSDSGKKADKDNAYPLTREQAIQTILENIPDSSAVVSTTGMASREVFEIREKFNQGHEKDFLTVGGMGHASQIAMGIASQISNKRVFCLDGDGAVIMHMGSLAISGVHADTPLVHIVLNNGAHDSVGGQATVGFDIDIAAVASACGYQSVSCVSSESDIKKELELASEASKPVLIEVRIQKGNRSDLGRPTSTPKQNKAAYTAFLKDEPVTYIGAGELQQLETLIIKEKYKNVFLVRGNASYQGNAKLLIEQLPESVDVVHFSDFEPNPNVADVKTAIEMLGSNAPDAVVAIGGGSAIDIAKLICVAVDRGYQQFVEDVEQGAKVGERSTPLIAVPTTAGTGSEATSFAVAYIGKTKYSLAGPAMRPDVAIIDPELSSAMPAKLTAEVSMDALAQAIESYWSVKSTPQSRSIALSAINMILLNIEKAVQDPCKESRAAMAQASHDAGRAINLTTTTAAHAVSYPITTSLGLAHGHAVACTLAEFLVINTSEENIASRLSGDLDPNEFRARIALLFEALSCDNAQSAAGVIYDLIDRIGLDVNLQRLGLAVPPEKEFTDGVNLQRLANNPVTIGQNDIDVALSQPTLVIG